MKLNKYLLMAAMGLGLVACTENDLVEGGDSNGAQNEGTTYVGFSLKFNASNTRATTTRKEDGTEAEQNIKTAYVMMADASGNVEQIISTTDKGTGTSNTNTDYYVFQTTAGVHYFYAVVNPDVIPSKEGDNANAKTINAYFNTGVTLTVANITSTADGGNFMMASENVLTADVEDGVTKDEALKGTKNCFAINVERATAKVTMTCDSETLTNATNNAGGTLDETQFTLKQGAGVSFRMAQASIIADDNNTFEYTSSPTSVYIKGTDPSEEEDYIHRSAAPVYCLENIRGSYLQGNTTYLTLQTTFTPAKVVDPDETQIKDLKENTYTGEDDNKTFYVVKQGELAGNYIMAEDLQSYRDSKSDQSALPAGVEAISDAYTNGNCYFGPIWIGQTDTDKDNAPVVRNTWYNLKITGITLPGDPQEPKPDPDQPLVPGTNVAITLSVMPWNFIDREIDLQ